MKNQVDWSKFYSGKTGAENLYRQFKNKAEALTVKVVRAAESWQAVEMIVKELKEHGIKKVAVAPLLLIDMKELAVKARCEEIDVCLRLDRHDIDTAGMGISEFNLGIAGLGSLVHDASNLHDRLVSMLPPVHLAILPTGRLVDTFDNALEVIEKVYGETMPPFLSFISGPSKTADIERQLTIGVHGPEKLIVLCVDRQEA